MMEDTFRGYSKSGISGDKTEANLGIADYWVVKLDNLGNIQWQNSIGGSNDDNLISVIQTSEGGYLLGELANLVFPAIRRRVVWVMITGL